MHQNRVMVITHIGAESDRNPSIVLTPGQTLNLFNLNFLSHMVGITAVSDTGQRWNLNEIM